MSNNPSDQDKTEATGAYKAPDQTEATGEYQAPDPGEATGAMPEPEPTEATGEYRPPAVDADATILSPVDDSASADGSGATTDFAPQSEDASASLVSGATTDYDPNARATAPGSGGVGRRPEQLGGRGGHRDHRLAIPPRLLAAELVHQPA